MAGPGRRKRKEKDVHVRELETRLQQRLGTRVEVADSGKGSGRVVVRYHSWEDLERLVRLITGG